MARIAVVTEIPTPYRRPVFDALRGDPGLGFDFYFLARAQADRRWGDHLSPGDAVLPGFQFCVRGHHTFHFNGGVRGLLAKDYAAFVLGGYAQPALLRIIAHARRREIPYVLMTESHFGKRRSRLKSALKEPWLRRIYGGSAANLVASTAAAEYVRHYGAPADAIFELPNSIDGAAYARAVDGARGAAREWRARQGWSDRPVLLHVGVLNARKGVDRLWEAFVSLRARHPGLALLWVGEGEAEAGLRAKAAASPGDVAFAGYVPPADLPLYYAAADIFALASVEEPFGAVVLEAMAAGLPVVTTDRVGAARDFVEAGANGAVVPAGSAAALAEALEPMVADAHWRRAMGARSREKMARWTNGAMADAIRRAVAAALRRFPPAIDGPSASSRFDPRDS